MDKDWYVYIITNKAKGVLYTGVTSYLRQRIYQHKNSFFDNSFSAKYKLRILVYYEKFENYESAFVREKYLKRWRREWKFSLIEGVNPEWRDLYCEVVK